MKLIKTITFLFVVAGLLFLPSTGNAQLLKGKIVGKELKDIAIEYTDPDDIIKTIRKDKIPVKNDSFSFDEEINVNTLDIVIYAGEDHVSAHLIRGKTLDVVITEKNGQLTADFKGDGASISSVINRMDKAYDLMRYYAEDEKDQAPTLELRKLLDTEHAAVIPLLKKIKNKEERDYYRRLNEAYYKNLKLRLILRRIKEEKTNKYEDLEYLQLSNDIDYNEETNVISKLSLIALQDLVKKQPKLKADMLPYCHELMDVVDQKITNQALRRQMADIIGERYFYFGDGSGDYHAFYNDFVKFAGIENADIPLKYKNMVDNWENSKTHKGSKAPDVTLTDKDGNKVQLSSLKGKFTYIDIWATWCGPCKKEIPYMEKLVEHFKDNDKVQFISISIDENVKAWKEMIDRDKPQWPQYVINGNTYAQFAKDWAIAGIPRFIMIDKDGNIFSPDATRPSNEETVKTIDEQIK